MADPASLGAQTNLYLVINENGFLISLRDEDLDAPAKRNRIGYAKDVQYKGRTVKVETTIIIRGKETYTLDRYLPAGDSEDE